MKRYLVITFFFVILHSCSVQESKTSLPDEKIKLVETGLTTPTYIEGDSTFSIEARMAHYGVPGVSIAVIYDGKIAWAKSYGIMDKDSKEPVTTETLFQAGSISKPVAAYGALRLADQHTIGLEEDINTYLTSWKIPENEFTSEKKVTLKNLLNHSGGITVHGFLGYSPDLPVPTLVQVLDGTPPANSGSIYVDKTPEESFRYSGGGYTIMQQMMIDVTGKNYPELMKELVLQPLEMIHSTYDQPLRGKQLDLAATGYLPDGSMTKGKRHTYPEMAAAGLWTTAEDLAKFVIDVQQTIKGESTKVLSKEMANMMLTPFVEDFTGLGIFLDKINDAVYFRHGGWDEGFSSELVAHKDQGYGVVVLTNSNHPAFISEVIQSVAHVYDWDEYFLSYKPVALDYSVLDDITGRYRVGGNYLIEVLQKDNLLYSQGLGATPQELVRISDSTYVRRDLEELIQFKIDSATGKMKMQFLNPDTHEEVYSYPLIEATVTLPVEFLLQGNFNQSLEAYQRLKKQNKNDPAVNEGSINSMGYNLLQEGKIKLAQDLFKINTLLYPTSSIAYDSYAEACMKIGELDLAIENYTKSLQLEPRNKNAEDRLAELRKLKTE